MKTIQKNGKTYEVLGEFVGKNMTTRSLREVPDIQPVNHSEEPPMLPLTLADHSTNPDLRPKKDEGKKGPDTNILLPTSTDF